MTISQAIVEWLNGYDSIQIDTNHIRDGSDRYGLFKSPTRNVKDFINEEYEITEYYQFFAKQSTQSDSERKEADEWLEDLAYWADDYSYSYAYPDPGNGRCITKIEITGNPCPMESDDHETLYEIALAVTYRREREEL